MQPHRAPAPTPDPAEIRALAAELEPYAIDCRRALHRIPEIGGTERETCAFVRARLTEEGVCWREVAGAPTATVGVIEGSLPGGCVMLRADIDGLPVREAPDNLAGVRPCVSEHEGLCHACGHDGHAAMLLAAARALARLAREGRLAGTAVLVFEAGEENAASVREVLAELRGMPIETCWGIHLYAGLPSGQICVEAGPRMTGADPLAITVHGQGGHGSRPDLARNPVFAAASILTNLAAAWVNQTAPDKPVILSPAVVKGGDAFNVIPYEAQILGTVRYFDVDAGAKAMRTVRSVAEHTAAMHGCTAEVASNPDNPFVPVVNDPQASALARRALEGVLPADALVSAEPWYASETFGRYQQLWPGVFAHLGIANPQVGSGAAHHTPQFDIDEGVVRTGVAATLAYALTALGRA